MKNKLILLCLAGLFTFLFVTSAQGQNVADTLDIGSHSSPFTYEESLDMSTSTWRCYKVTLFNYMKLSVLYDMVKPGTILVNLYDADMNRIERLSLDGRKGEKTYMRELPSGTYYFCYNFGRGWVSITVAGEQLPDAAVHDSHNYVRTRTMTTKDGSGYLENIQYFDALGRLHESVDAGITPTGKDLVSLIEYDEFGREEKKWLPTLIGNNDGKYVLRSLLKNTASATYRNEMKPYGSIEYEKSPLNRVKIRCIPGAKEFERELVTYERNRKNGESSLTDRNHKGYNPIRYENGISKGNYPVYSLEIKSTDKLDGCQTIEYMNVQGQLILSRQVLRKAGSQVNDGLYADVQYLYDNIGNLLYVYTPTEADRFTGPVDPGHYIYRYQYDYRDRRIAVQIPQCGWTYYVYDRADRLILSQDGEQRATNQWTFYKYDTMGRKVLQGTCTTTRTHSELRTLCRTLLVEENFDKTLPRGYTWNKLADIIPFDSPILNAYYYDNYDILGHQGVANHSPVFKGDACYAADNGEYESHGLLTLSSTAILGGNSAAPLHKLHYYDRMERSVAIISDIYSPQNGVQDYKQAEYIAYTFSGNVASKTLCLVGKEDEKYDYTYDHANRHISTRYNLFSSQTDFQTNTYDELGNLMSTVPLGLTDQATTYAYDIHSRLVSLQQKHFGEELEYTKGGNISKQKFQKDGAYTFTYDKLSRVEQAVYSNGMVDRSCSFVYDKNGNLTYLKRSIGTGYESIYMRYNGNRMREATRKADVNDDYAFKKYADSQNEYLYNANGSITRIANRGVSGIKYNLLNLPGQMDVKHTSAEARNEYTYNGEGRKLNVNYRWNPQYLINPVIGSAVNESSLTMSRNVLYQGNHIWYDNKEMWLNEIGYRRPETSKFYFYVKDHQGNNRAVIDQSGNVVQKNDYYPYGLPMGNAAGVPSEYYVDTDGQPFKYNEKELERMHGIVLYDYLARLMEPAFPRFLTVDPSCEKYYYMSPYAYCANNFVNAIDPDGRDIVILLDPKGAQRFGHAAMLIGNDKDGWKYYSKDGVGDDESSPMSGASKKVKGVLFSTINDFNKSDNALVHNGYPERTRFATTSEQDEEGEKAVLKILDSNYNLFTSNCVQAVAHALVAAGLNPGINSPTPSNFLSVREVRSDYSIIPRRLYRQMALYNPDKIVPTNENEDGQSQRSTWADFKNQLGLWLIANPNIKIIY